MAVSYGSFRLRLEKDKLMQRRLVDTMRARHGIAADRDCRIETQDRDYGNTVEVALTFAPGAIGLPASLSEKLDKVAERLHDPFRGPVIQAAVPELHNELVALLAACKDFTQPIRFVMSLDMARAIIGENA